MQKYTITKWLVRIGAGNQPEIQPREVSTAMPINRMLDKTGLYYLTSVQVSGKTYMIAYDPEEEYQVKSSLLVAKIDVPKNLIVDMEESDRDSIPEIARQFMGYHPATC